MLSNTASNAARCASRIATRTQRRNMAGGAMDPKMGVHKNKMIEEWTGRREITELEFSVNASNIKALFLTCIVFPVGVYFATKSELEQHGGRRYKQVFNEH